MDMRASGSVLLLPLLPGACGIQRYQSTFSDAAVEVRQFNSLFLAFLIVCGVLYLLVIGFSGSQSWSCGFPAARSTGSQRSACLDRDRHARPQRR
jgi:hypothetical protein